jgi:hypothetical protein
VGYDIHITKAREWTESEKNPVPIEKWLAMVRSSGDLELREDRHGAWTGHPEQHDVWFLFDRGEITAKNPDEPTLARAIALAAALDARVVGDDGEVYEETGAPPAPAKVSLGARVSAWLGRLKPAPTVAAIDAPFTVGDRVRDSWGHEATVIFVDVHAEHGLGAIRVRYDDGRELQSAAIAHGLTRVG